MRYDAIAVALHWLIALLIAAQFTLGWWMVGLPDEGGGQVRWYNLHKSLGVVLGLLAIARLAWRAGHAAPPLPAGVPAWQRRSAAWGHTGLYACLVGLPLTGYLGSSFSGYPVRFFGWALPAWGWKWPAAKALLGDLHLGLTWLLAALVALHVGAALAHLFRRDGVFSRMLFHWRNA